MAEERALQSQVFFGIDPEKTFSFFSGYIVAKKKKKRKPLVIEVIMQEEPTWGHIKCTLCIWVTYERT